MDAMTTSQYRCICAHMSFWARGIDEAMIDCGITCDKKELVDELGKAGWVYDWDKDTLEYHG